MSKQNGDSPLAGTSATRRGFLGGAAAAAVGATLVRETSALAAQDKATEKSLAASPPPGFTPMSAPGTVVKVMKAGSLKANKLYPNEADAKEMLTKALAEFTGEKTLTAAVKRFVHKDDKVVVKVNGIALRNMSTNLELVVPFIQAMIDSGVTASNITVLEQYGGFLSGTRITQQSLPEGVKIHTHGNGNASMAGRMIPGTGTTTKFVDALVNATAAINFALIKDHSICGYTGMLKNMTHGCSINPHDFHVHHASPQIAMMYAQDVIRTRVRLCITDGFKVMAHGGPLDKQPQYRFPYEAVLVSTDPVAMDAVGWEIVEKFRAENKLKSLTDEGRPPAYIPAAAGLGLGVADRQKITVKEFKLA